MKPTSSPATRLYWPIMGHLKCWLLFRGSSRNNPKVPSHLPLLNCQFIISQASSYWFCSNDTYFWLSSLFCLSMWGRRFGCIPTRLLFCWSTTGWPLHLCFVFEKRILTLQTKSQDHIAWDTSPKWKPEFSWRRNVVHISGGRNGCVFLLLSQKLDTICPKFLHPSIVKSCLAVISQTDRTSQQDMISPITPTPIAGKPYTVPFPLTLSI